MQCEIRKPFSDYRDALHFPDSLLLGESGNSAI